LRWPSTYTPSLIHPDNSGHAAHRTSVSCARPSGKESTSSPPRPVFRKQGMSDDEDFGCALPANSRDIWGIHADTHTHTHTYVLSLCLGSSAVIVKGGCVCCQCSECDWGCARTREKLVVLTMEEKRRAPVPRLIRTLPESAAQYLTSTVSEMLRTRTQQVCWTL
jgi:hypothetical protein